MKRRGGLAGIGIVTVLAAGTAAFWRMEKEEESKYIEPVFARWSELVMPSVGEVRLPVFMVEFQDVKFKETMVSQEELEEWIFTGEESVAGYHYF